MNKKSAIYSKAKFKSKSKQTCIMAEAIYHFGSTNIKKANSTFYELFLSKAEYILMVFPPVMTDL